MGAKESGSYYTPAGVAAALVQWAVRKDSDTLLDPSCGDGRFVVRHANSVGVERDGAAAAAEWHSWFQRPSVMLRTQRP